MKIVTTIHKAILSNVQPGVKGDGSVASQNPESKTQEPIGSPTELSTLLGVAGTATALTDNIHEQDEILDGFTRYWDKAGVDYNRGLLKRFFQSVQVETRHLALPIDDYPNLADFTEANEAFVEVGSNLAERCVREALKRADLTPDDVDAIFFTTVTGVTVPTIDAILTNRIGFRRDVKRSPFFGLGCVAGAAGMARVADYLKAWPDQVAVLVSVELCSLTLQKDDLSIPAMVSAALFGDGAAAVVAIGKDRLNENAVKQTAYRPHTQGSNGRPMPRVLATKSVFYPDTERVMGWDIGTSGFRVVLSADVPSIVEKSLRSDVEAFLREHDLQLADIQSWVCHPGGPKVVKATQASLGLTDEDMICTWESLRSVGNLSSSSVLFVLDETIRAHAGPEGSLGMMIAMGPGFCSEMILFRW